MNITIEKNVPIPPVAEGRRRYPFFDMDVGESFSVPLSGEETKAGKNGLYDKNLVRVRSAASNHQRRHGKKFVVRQLRDEGVIRCWRVA